jgi:hypothetical protein
MKKLFYFSLIILCGCSFSNTNAGQLNDPVLENMMRAWDVVWERFYHPDTNLFYDYISSYEKGQELSHLPTANEVSRQYPNPCGYGTGMEDCMILGGLMLGAIVDMYEVKKEASLKEAISKVFLGVKRCCTIHNVSGFVARGVCVEDGKSVYINSSRDQYTHCVHGLWKYYHSPLSDDIKKSEIREILVAIAERMRKNVTPGNNYDSLRADGKQCPLGISRMWNVEAHEAARLPMIYAATWDMTGEKKYYDLYRSYIDDALEQSENILDSYNGWSCLQMQCSFELLHQLESDTAMKERWYKLMYRVNQMAFKRAIICKDEICAADRETLSMPGPDWRTVKEWDEPREGYKLPRWGEYHSVWYSIRDVGERMIAVCMFDDSEQKLSRQKLMEEVISSINYREISSCGIIYHIAAYWKARKLSMSATAPD